MYSTLSKYYDYVFPAGKAQISFFKALFKSGHVSGVLDIACGSGSYALEFSSWGIKVVGIDYEPEMVELARSKARTAGLTADFRQGDMRDLSGLPENFDAALCIGNSIVHLVSKEDLRQSLQETNRHLRQGGIYVIQTVNYDRILKYCLTSLPEIRNEEQGLTFTRDYLIKSNDLIEFITSLKIDGPDGPQIVHRGSVNLRPLTANRLTAALEKAGLVTEQLYGGFDQSAHTIDSPATVVVARKKKQA